MAAKSSSNKEEESDDEDGFFMADFFTKDLNVEEDFEYNYGDLKINLKGVAREYGQTILGSGDGTGLTIWRGAEELCNYLFKHPDKAKNKRCLELGAGLGLVGILMSHLDPSLSVITDGDDDSVKRIVDNFAINHFISQPAATSEVEVEGEEKSDKKEFCPSSPATVVPFCLENTTNSSGVTKVCHVVKFLWEDENHKALVASLSSDNVIQAGQDQSNTAAACDGNDVVGGGSSSSGDAPCGVSRPGNFDLIVAADVIYQVEAVIPLVSAVTSLLEKSNMSRFILSFARRNVPVQHVIDEGTKKGLICKKVEEFECATSGENIYEFQWHEDMLSAETPDTLGI